MGTSQKQAINRLTLAVDKYVTAIWIEQKPGYTWLQSLRDAGYKELYATKACSQLWARAEKMMAERKEKLEVKQKWDLAFVDEQYRTLLDKCHLVNDRTNAKGCLDSMSRRLAGFTDKISSTNEEITQLTPEEEAITDEAVRLAKIQLARSPSVADHGVDATNTPIIAKEA